ncbi:MAG: YggS family pyridoxal phosphate-dependent enzyme [Desulfobacterales bacterium]|nr:YggS family pyridoxal phosphate-dependent enzyme [Desulfobacterales bacterium]
MVDIGKNLESIRKRVAAAAVRVGRHPDGIGLVAVSKRVPLERIQEAVCCGQFLFGENYPQEARDKITRLPEALRRKVNWHFIGHLQSNKAGIAAEHFQVIETVDRIKLVRALDQRLQTRNRKLRVLVQVNIGRESRKSGVLPEGCGALLREISRARNLIVTGLMAIPPHADDPETSRPYFRQLRQLAEALRQEGLLGRAGPVQLSMGMSNDFEVAIEEGATLVRIGTAIFGPRRLA